MQVSVRRAHEETSKSDALVRKRIEVLFVIFALLIIALIARAGYWQIYKADWLKSKAQDQWTREIRILADRGDILDRHGNPLAISTSCYTVVLQPGVIKEQAEILNKDNTDQYIDALCEDLAAVLGLSPDDVKAYATKQQNQVILMRYISDKTADAIEGMQYSYTVEKSGVTETKTISYNGILINSDMKREYPMGSFLTQVLGFMAVDGNGLEGIEGRFDKYLAGKNGKLTVETDREGVKIGGSLEEREEPVNGDNLQLTIDVTLQSFAENAVEACMNEWDPESASMIVMDPETGAVLAMVTKPDYDNNNPPRSDYEMLRSLTANKNVSGLYSPGSAFEIITAAAAIDTDSINTNTFFNCEGEKTIDGQKLNCSTDEAHGSISLNQAFLNSCSVAFMEMAEEMGVDTFYRYIEGFGFGSKSGIELYNELAGELTPEKYVRDVELARIGFGDSIMITPLQYAAALSTIANGGERMKPYIAQKVISNEGKVLKEYSPESEGTIISDYTSDTILEYLFNIVDNGAGRYCQVPGYEIGGISGNTAKYDDEGLIIHDAYTASFAAVAPIGDPKLVVVLLVDEPKAGSNYGSKVAAPYIGDFLEEALPYLNIMPDSATNENGTKKEVPNVVNMTLEDAVNKIKQQGFGCIIEGFDGKIVTQIPGAGTMLEAGDNVVIQLAQVSDEGESYLVEVPDLFGLKPTEALKLLTENNLTMRIVSSGNVVLEQYPDKGTEVLRGTQIAVEFDYYEDDDEETED